MNKQLNEIPVFYAVDDNACLEPLGVLESFVGNAVFKICLSDIIVDETDGLLRREIGVHPADRAADPLRDINIARETVPELFSLGSRSVDHRDIVGCVNYGVAADGAVSRFAHNKALLAFDALIVALDDKIAR